MKTSLATIININEEIAFLQYGYKTALINTPQYLKTKNTIQNDEIQQVMSKRELKFLNTTEDKLYISVNRTIIDYVDEYVKLKKLPNEIIAPIN